MGHIMNIAIHFVSLLSWAALYNIYVVDGRNVTVEIDLDNVVNTVDERYLSVALEASIFKKHWATFNIR